MESRFDDYARNYDSALKLGLSLSGESKEYFAHQRVRWLAARLSDLGVRPFQVLDYGCGTGGRFGSAPVRTGEASPLDHIEADRLARRPAALPNRWRSVRRSSPY